MTGQTSIRAVTECAAVSVNRLDHAVAFAPLGPVVCRPELFAFGMTVVTIIRLVQIAMALATACHGRRMTATALCLAFDALVAADTGDFFRPVAAVRKTRDRTGPACIAAGVVGVAVTQRAGRFPIVTSVAGLHTRQQIIGRLQAGILQSVTDDTAGCDLAVQAMRKNHRIHRRLSST